MDPVILVVPEEVPAVPEVDLADPVVPEEDLVDLVVDPADRVVQVVVLAVLVDPDFKVLILFATDV